MVHGNKEELQSVSRLHHQCRTSSSVSTIGEVPLRFSIYFPLLTDSISELRQRCLPDRVGNIGCFSKWWLQLFETMSSSPPRIASDTMIKGKRKVPLDTPHWYLFWESKKREWWWRDQTSTKELLQSWPTMNACSLEACKGNPAIK
jgi:hypothetical protein